MDNSKEVLDKLDNVNNPSSIHTYDLSTRYTNLPLDLVRNELFEMIDRYFDINERKSTKYIVLNHFWETAQFASVNANLLKLFFNLYLEKPLFNKLSNKFLLRISKSLNFEQIEENLTN